MDRIQRTLKLVNDEAPIGVTAPVETTFQPREPATVAGVTQSVPSIVTPELKACAEIESNSKQIDEIQKLLDSIK